MKSAIIIVLCGVVGILLTSAVYKPAALKPAVRVYLLMGQSNMAGRGVITAEYSAMANSRVQMLTKNLRWVTARHPLHFDKPQVAGVGPGLSFGIELAKAYPDDTIALVPCAVGGTSINKWAPGAYDSATGTHPYDDALVRIKYAKSKGTIRGVIWLQGESDSGTDEAVSSYLDKLTALISAVRKEVGNNKLPWVAGELGRYRERYVRFNKELNKLPERVSHTATVSSDSLWHRGDTTHFDSHSATIYGTRFAKAMLSLR